MRPTRANDQWPPEELARLLSRVDDATGAVLAAYQTLQHQLDEAMAPYWSRLGTRVRCRPGCDLCCELESVLAVEALVLARGLAAMARPGLAVQPGRCPLLRAGRCVVYRHRPFICRSHGLAVGYPDPARGILEVSACPENFPADTSLAEEDIFILEPFTAELHRLSHRLAPDAPRVRLATVVELYRAGAFAGLPVSGTLP